MIPVEEGWKAALATSHERWATVRPVLPAGGYGEPVPISAGSITLDGSSDVRRSVELTIHEPLLLPINATDPLLPLGQRLDVRVGVRTPSGVVYELGLGWHFVHEVTVERPGLSITVRAYDQAARLSQHLVRGPVAPKRGETVRQLVARVLSGHQVAPAVTGSFHPWADKAASGEWDMGTPVWTVIREAADAVECAAWFDRTGTLQVRPRVEDQSTPQTVQHQLAVGGTGTLTGYSVTVSREGAANEVISRIDPAGDKKAPATWRAAATTGGLAVQTVGHMTRIDQTTSAAPSSTEAKVRAERRLTAWSGLLRTGTASGVPDHSIEAWDSVEIETMDGQLTRHYISSVTLPLGPTGEMDLRLVSDAVTPSLTGGW